MKKAKIKITVGKKETRVRISNATIMNMLIARDVLDAEILKFTEQELEQMVRDTVGK